MTSENDEEVEEDEKSLTIPENADMVELKLSIEEADDLSLSPNNPGVCFFICNLFYL